MTTVSRRLQKIPDTRSDAPLFHSPPAESASRGTLGFQTSAPNISANTFSSLLARTMRNSCHGVKKKKKSVFHTDAHLHSERDRLETRGLGQGKKEGEKNKTRNKQNNIFGGGARCARGRRRWMFARCTSCKLEASDATRMQKTGTQIFAYVPESGSLTRGWRSLNRRLPTVRCPGSLSRSASPQSVCYLCSGCGCTVIKVCEEGEGTAAQVSFPVPQSSHGGRTCRSSKDLDVTSSSCFRSL